MGKKKVDPEIQKLIQKLPTGGTVSLKEFAKRIGAPVMDVMKALVELEELKLVTLTFTLTPSAFTLLHKEAMRHRAVAAKKKRVT